MIHAAAPALLATSLLRPKVIIGLIAAFAALVVIYKLIVRTERAGNQVAIINWILGLVVAESLLWGQDSVPFGPFHPQFGSQNFRLYDVLIPVALIARLRVHGRPRRMGAAAIALLAFIAWYFVCAAIGVLNYNPFSEITFQLKLVIYLGGSFALVSGTPRDQLLGPQGILRLIRPMAVATAAFMALYVFKLTLSIPGPGIHVQGVEGVYEDAAAVLIGLGVIGLVVELCRPRRSGVTILACLVLMLSAVTSDQRAVLLQLSVAVIVVVLAWLAPSTRPRFLTHPTEVLLVVLTLAALVLAPPVLRGDSPFNLHSLPLGSKVAVTFTSEGKVESAEQRVSQLQELAQLIPERPIFGWGLGKTFVYYATGVFTYVPTSISHNIFGDLLLRGGIMALLLWAAAMALPVWAAIRTWRRHPDPIVAAAALGAAAAVLSLIAHGAVESIFEKYRIALALGLYLGVAHNMSLDPVVPVDGLLVDARTNGGLPGFQARLS